MFFRVIGLLGLAASLAGCDIVVPKAEERAASELGNAAAQLGEVAMNLTVDLPPEAMRNSRFEIGGVPMIEGGAITGVTLDAAGDGAPRINLAFTAPTTPEQVRSYFVEQFRAQGVAATLIADALTGRTPDGTAFAMRFLPQGTGTAGTIAIDPAQPPQ